jgi:prevent-host-death family protein
MTIAAGEFKATCLKLMDKVNETHETVVITKRGVPVAKLVPVSEHKSRGIFGSLRGFITAENDIISPVEEAWDATVDETSDE